MFVRTRVCILIALFLTHRSSLWCTEFNSINWSGYEWHVKESTDYTGPGPNLFSAETIRQDSERDFLSIKTVRRDNDWYCGEIYSLDLFSHGSFTLTFSFDAPLDNQAVFGFFLYNDELPPLYNEIDFEISRWAVPEGPEFHFSIQPYNKKGNSQSFSIDQHSGFYKMSIHWDSESITFVLCDEKDRILQSMKYRGKDLPVIAESRIHINFWLFRGDSPAGDGTLSVELRDFEYNPTSK